MPHTPPSIEELKSLRKPLRNINIEHREKLSGLDRAALFVTRYIGTFGFFLIIAGWTIGWIAWNTLAPDAARFDPYPAFVLWLFIANMIQILLMPLIMTGQSLQGRHMKARAEADFEINVKAEREIEAILQHLENQHELLSKMARKLESDA